MDVISRIREHYDELNKAQHRIADYLLAHPDICGFASLRQLADATDTTSATILNFSRKLGFSGFSEMKSSLQNCISKCMMPIRLDAAVDSYCDSAFEMTIKTEQDSLRTTFDQTDPTQYEAAVQLIAEANNIYTFSYDFSPVLADFFTSRFKRVGLNVIDLSHMPLTDALHSLASIQENDLLVLFSFPIYSKIVVSIAEYFQSKAQRIICFTDNPSSPAATFSTIAITSSANHIFFFNSMTSTISTINVLASMYLSNHKDVFDEHRANFEALQNYLHQKEVLSLALMDPSYIP